MDSCFSEYRISQQDVRMRVGERPKTFGAMKVLFNVKKRESFEGVVVLTMIYEAETFEVKHGS